MIDERELAYDFDEELEGFGAPVTPAGVGPPGVPAATKVSVAVLGLGLLALVAQLSGGFLAGTWPGVLASYGLIVAGAAAAFWTRQRGAPPGIRHDGVFFRGLLSRGALGWLAGILMTGLYVLIYFFPAQLGDRGDGRPSGLVATVDPIARVLTDAPASRWFLYGVLYTLAIAVFAVRMAMKYRGNRYQLARTLSVTLFQLVFAWTLPNLLVRFQRPYMELNGVWPLKHDYLWPSKVVEPDSGFLASGPVGIALLVLAVLLVVATPILTWRLGKRWYCSWVCGCGGLAETLGDPWRQLSSKSEGAWRLERWLVHGVLLVVVAATALVWIDYATSGAVWGTWSAGVRFGYGFLIGAVFSGVVGVGFYPLLGSRVWCRFGCPQAAILGIFQRAFSRFRITTNGGQCMSCGNCSTYCEMGIDVRAYAQSSENVVRASCVGCGVCAAVCPRGVLRLENGPVGDRFEGSENPLGVLRDSLRDPVLPVGRAWDATGERE